MARNNRRYFHPTFALSWYEFVIGGLIGGIVLGIGWEIGATIVNRWLGNDRMSTMGTRRP